MSVAMRTGGFGSIIRCENNDSVGENPVSRPCGGDTDIIALLIMYSICTVAIIGLYASLSVIMTSHGCPMYADIRIDVIILAVSLASHRPTQNVGDTILLCYIFLSMVYRSLMC
jgi:hypothetical protein